MQYEPNGTAVGLAPSLAAAPESMNRSSFRPGRRHFGHHFYQPYNLWTAVVPPADVGASVMKAAIAVGLDGIVVERGGSSMCATYQLQFGHLRATGDHHSMISWAGNQP